jgi:translation initiation factor 1A
LIFKEDGQEYAQVLRMLGNGRLEAQCIDGTKRLCHIRGKMRKKVWVNQGDIILVGLRDYQDAKGDVILKYMADEARSLKQYGELPENIRVNDTDAMMEGEENENAEYVFAGQQLQQLDTDHAVPQQQDLACACCITCSPALGCFGFPCSSCWGSACFMCCPLPLPCKPKNRFAHWLSTCFVRIRAQVLRLRRHCGDLSCIHQQIQCAVVASVSSHGPACTAVAAVHGSAGGTVQACGCIPAAGMRLALTAQSVPLEAAAVFLLAEPFSGSLPLGTVVCFNQVVHGRWQDQAQVAAQNSWQPGS